MAAQPARPPASRLAVSDRQYLVDSRALSDHSPGPGAPSGTSGPRRPAGPLAVAFNDVDFGYEDEGLVLSELGWSLDAGQVVGILGRTGSGKTTITRLLCRLYDPLSGEVRVGGVDLRDIPLADLRYRVGIVTQDVHLFEASVRDNLTLFAESITDNTILRGR